MNDAPQAEPVIERPQPPIEQPAVEPMTNDTVLYRLDDVTLEITSGTWTELAPSMGQKSLSQKQIENIIYGRLMIMPDFSAYYDRDEAALKDVKQDIEIVRNYAARQISEGRPCYISTMLALTELDSDIITHVLNVCRRRAPV